MSSMKRTTKVRLTVALILVLAIFLGLFDFPQVVTWFNQKTGLEVSFFDKIPFKLGLDLQGGTQLVYDADLSQIKDSEKSDAMDGVRDVIERRVNAFGVAEPIVQIDKAQGNWRIIVELAGVKDVNEAIKMIGETPLLEFKEKNTEPKRELTAQEKKDMEAYNKAAKAKADKALLASKKGLDFVSLVKEYSENDNQKASSGDLGWVKEKGQYSVLYSKAKEIGKGDVFPGVIEMPNSYNVMMVTDKRENGTEVKANHILICYKGATRCTKETSKEDALKQINDLKAQATAKNFVELAKKNSTEPGADKSGGDLGWFAKGQMVKPFEDVVFTMQKGSISDVVETEFGYHLILKQDERPIVEYKISDVSIKKQTEADILPPQDEWKITGLTGKQLESSSVQFSPNTNLPTVALKFNDEGKKLFGEITERNVNKQVAIFLDGQIISAPRVTEAIKDGQAVIEGDFTTVEAKTLSQRLNAGALPVPINLVSQQTVGASLGNESLALSLKAGLIGLLLVVLLMVLYYRLPGVVSVITLSIYAIVVLFIFKAVPVTMTLAGIAGFILSIGMAVDANVLIFERMKEELKLGKPLGTAIEEGFKRAWPSIRDGNVTTILTCIILFWFGSSTIKGFALTLIIGVLISMFSAIVIARQFMLLTLRSQTEERKLWWFGVRKETLKAKE